MRDLLSTRSGFGLRLAGVAMLFLVTTGQASTEGCGEVPAKDDAEVAAADTPATAPEPVVDPDAADTGTAAQTASAAEGVAEGDGSTAMPPGRYSCTENMPRSVNGFWESEQETRGYVILEPGGRYTDPHRVGGTYRHDAASGTTLFSGGLLDHATATRIVTQETRNRFRVEIPTRVGSGDDFRWGKNRRWLCNRTS